MDKIANLLIWVCTYTVCALHSNLQNLYAEHSVRTLYRMERRVHSACIVSGLQEFKTWLWDFIHSIRDTQVKPAIECLNLSWFSRNRPRFQTCMDRLNVPKSINQLGHNQPVGLYMRLLLVAVLATSNNRCVLLAVEHNGTAGGIALSNRTVYGRP